MSTVSPNAAEVTGVSKTYGGIHALRGVDFSIGVGEVRALLGKNGAGKSTLIRLLAGAESPEGGQVVIGGKRLERPNVSDAQRLGVRTVYQELSLIPELTVAENMFMGEWPMRGGRIDRRLMLEKADEALSRLGVRVDPRAWVGDISIADQQMVEIARSMSRSPRVLILDEPTSSLAAAEVDRVLEAVATIKQSGVAVVYVSHRVSEIRRIADSATVMRNGEVVATFPIAERTTREMVDMMLGVAGEDAERVQVPLAAGPPVVEVRGLVVEPKLHGIDLDVRPGEVLGIAGVLGSGRTELLQVIAGVRNPDSGTVTVNGTASHGRGHRFAQRLGVGLTPEDRKTDGIVPELGLDENLVMSDFTKVATAGVLSSDRVKRAAVQAMEAMSIKSASSSTPIGALSGGNQQKVVIGRWLHAGSSILLLDEPTRGVDVMAKQQIYELLRSLARSGKAVVFVSSEMEELNLVCDRVVVLNGGLITAEHTAPAIETDQLLLAAIAEPA
ncbi:sugar ABC transporter ATP-binding protein [Phycicoccus sp. Soil802]|uniref:sugar ABC transporter ATP-binding protein n=1 Tax=Phycicoccus sp. Soil802 TaxID=1736414 RepID=UPI0007039902|nr:sugar ABC transporter ATP-binding protein [Phycicoccus sp. Soil802]KRF22353.1 heme ABC transporter ATP-binding protein [Phycicoccus sp. Soil802]